MTLGWESCALRANANERRIVSFSTSGLLDVLVPGALREKALVIGLERPALYVEVAQDAEDRRPLKSRDEVLEREPQRLVLGAAPICGFDCQGQFSVRIVVLQRFQPTDETIEFILITEGETGLKAAEEARKRWTSEVQVHGQRVALQKS